MVLIIKHTSHASPGRRPERQNNHQFFRLFIKREGISENPKQGMSGIIAICFLKMHLFMPVSVPVPVSVIDNYYSYLHDNDNDHNYYGIEK